MTAVDLPWDCQICSKVLATCQELAAHLMDWHDEWLLRRVLPPPRVRSSDEFDDI